MPQRAFATGVRERSSVACARPPTQDSLPCTPPTLSTPARSVFGPETAAEYEARPGGTATPAGLAGLLQRLQEAQRAQQGAAAAAAQHGVRGGYELTDPGVLLPASLSPLPAPRALAPAFGGPGAEAALAAAGLAANASMLAAVAAAWQARGLGRAGVARGLRSAELAASLLDHPPA